ncbi:MAG: sulfite exporter TauE/SafE family protein [Candidatus Eisenbacteria bacterium]|uniref:Probable membrane transporter protein n=1 Tax=Eiseniibacteriota bacterium TaxID=2212470 RepID=A0A849SLI2_UNCEI|nr:sulfite exporter TauE/SafE family protein [Candidatus Eisenbacteria bacterium]
MSEPAPARGIAEPGAAGAPELITGLIAGGAGGLFGVGGGIVLIPLLTGWSKLTQHRAHGTSLAAIGATAIGALATYAAFGNVRWDVALVVGLASTLTARFGARLANRVSGTGLKRAFAVFLLLVALRLLWRVPEPLQANALEGPLRWGVLVTLGALVGLLASFFGVGGGILAVPAFTLLFGMSQQMAQGTSLGVILVTAPVGAYEHSKLGNVAWRRVPWLAAGSLVGAPLAAWLAQWLPHEGLVRAFAGFLALSAVQTWFRARPRPASQPS